MAWISHVTDAATLGSYMQSRYGSDGLNEFAVSSNGVAGSVVVLIRR